jgi:hypothetical protein
MPSLNIDGHSVTVDEGFTKLSPEEQNATVDQIAAQIHADAKPSGVVAGLSHGIAGVPSGLAKTANVLGVETPGLDAVAKSSEPANYKAAHLIREGGHWYNPSDYSPSAIPQILAEQAPGLLVDASAGWTAGKLAPGGPAVKALAGLGGFAGSAALRTFGHGAQANADARTGTPNSPVETKDLTREVGKQALEAPFNMIGASRILPVGKLAGSALAKYGTTVGTEMGVGGLNDLVDQAGTTLGSKEGFKYDPNRTAEAAVTRAVGSGALVAPRLAADLHGNSKYGSFEADAPTKAAAEALAARQLAIADGRSLSNAKVGAEAVGGAHSDVHSELAAASKGETLSQDNANTLKRINEGGKASPSEITALADEASPETMHLARQALLSAKLKGMGQFSEDKFTGGISGAMERLKPISNPIGTLAATGAAGLVGHAAGLGLLGTYGAPILGGLYGGYGAARILDKMSGLRSPAKGFTDRYGGTDTPVRLPEAPVAPNEPLSTSVPQVAPPQNTQLWGTPAHEALDANALNTQVKSALLMAAARRKIEGQRQAEGIAEDSPAINDQGGVSALSNPAFAKRGSQLLSAARVMKKLTAEPVTADEPAPAAPEAPNLSPVAMKMLQQKLKQGLPPEAPPAPPPAPEAPQINPTALAMVQKKMKQPLPQSPVPNAGPPASPAISALMTKLNGQVAPTANAAPVVPETSPAPPIIATINKKNGKVNETPHPEAEQPYQPIAKEDLWRKMLTDSEVADKELNSYGPKVREKYGKNVEGKRSELRDMAEAIANEHSPADANVAAALYHDLDHISRRKVAARSIAHFVKLMSPAAANAVNAHFTPKVLERMWKSE